MACFRCLYCNRRAHGHCNFNDQKIFYLSFFRYCWFSFNYLFLSRFLDECETLCTQCKKKSAAVFVSLFFRIVLFIFFVKNKTMVLSAIDLYNILRTKIGDNEAKVLAEYIETKVETSFKKK